MSDVFWTTIYKYEIDYLIKFLLLKNEALLAPASPVDHHSDNSSWKTNASTRTTKIHCSVKYSAKELDKKNQIFSCFLKVSVDFFMRITERMITHPFWLILLCFKLTLFSPNLFQIDHSKIHRLYRLTPVYDGFLSCTYVQFYHKLYDSFHEWFEKPRVKFGKLNTMMYSNSANSVGKQSTMYSNSVYSNSVACKKYTMSYELKNTNSEDWN
jgi:hypothetical protein